VRAGGELSRAALACRARPLARLTARGARAPQIAGYRLREAELLFENDRAGDADRMLRTVLRKNPRYAGTRTAAPRPCMQPRCSSALAVASGCRLCEKAPGCSSGPRKRRLACCLCVHVGRRACLRAAVLWLSAKPYQGMLMSHSTGWIGSTGVFAAAKWKGAKDLTLQYHYT